MMFGYSKCYKHTSYGTKSLEQVDRLLGIWIWLLLFILPGLSLPAYGQENDTLDYVVNNLRKYTVRKNELMNFDWAKADVPIVGEVFKRDL